MPSGHAQPAAVDRIYIAASALDGRFTRICVASVRYFYPDARLFILVGGTLEPGLSEELTRYWNVGFAEIPRRDYGWGFVKLEPLFAAGSERFLVLDSDTVMAGTVLDWAAANEGDFIVDDETATPERSAQIYYDCEQAARDKLDVPKPGFLFNTGQWFGRAGKLRREDFDGLIAWGAPPKLCRPDIFKNGEQGALNFVVNEKSRRGEISVARVNLMVWPGHDMEGITARAIAERRTAATIIHWAGLKKARLKDMTGSDVLNFFEREYYRRLPGGGVRRHLAAWRHVLAYWRHEAATRWRLAARRVGWR